MAFYEGSFTVGAISYRQPFTEDQVGFPPGRLHVSIEEQAIRYRYGDEPPTTTSGHPIVAGADLVFTKTKEIVNLKFIAQTGTATIQFTVEGK